MSDLWMGGTAVVLLAFVATVALDYLGNRLKRDTAHRALGATKPQQPRFPHQ